MRVYWWLQTIASRFHGQLFTILLAAALALWTSAGCVRERVDRPKLPQGVMALLKDTLHSGDVIFRRGSGLASRLVMLCDRDSEYSHVGIVLVDSTGFSTVIHALPQADDGEKGGTVQENVYDFVGSPGVNAWAVYRVLDSDPKRAARAARIAAGWAQLKLPFDYRFDLRRRNASYCTVLVVRAFHEAGIDLVPNALDAVGMNGSARLLLISDLLKSRDLRLIVRKPGDNTRRE